MAFRTAGTSRTRPDARALLTSIQPGSVGSPRGFYATGQIFDGEDVLELELARQFS